jgi:hypothetical protein
MSVLSQETRNVQNPALGAMLLWRFTVGYEEASKVKAPAPLPLLFIVLPMIYHQETSELISSTLKASGLRNYVNKFLDTKTSKSDLVYSIHDRAIKMRGLSLESLGLATASKLLSVDQQNGAVFSLSTSSAKSGIPQSVQSLLKSAEKLGSWCGAISMHEVSVILKIRF